MFREWYRTATVRESAHFLRVRLERVELAGISAATARVNSFDVFQFSMKSARDSKLVAGCAIRGQHKNRGMNLRIGWPQNTKTP
jgi:hypothetical protein